MDDTHSVLILCDLKENTQTVNDVTFVGYITTLLLVETIYGAMVSD
jgi:hypothetical protein